MMGIFLRRMKYWMCYSVNGRQVRASTDTINKKLAESIYHKRMALIAENKHLDAKRCEKVFFKDFAQTYLERHAIPYKKSWKTDKDHLANLMPFFGQKYLYEITSLMIEDYKREREKKVKRSTIRRELGTFGAMLNKAVQWRLLQESPMRDVVRYKGADVDSGRIRYLEKNEILRLLDCCLDRQLKNIVILALHTGMRKGEIQRLEWNHIDFRRRQLLVAISKNGTKRYISLNRSAIAALMAQPKYSNSLLVFANEEGKLYNFRKAFDTAIKRSGIRDFRFHDLRHTFASHLVMAGMSLYTVMGLMGHKSLTMTQRYSHLSPDFQAQAVDVLDRSITNLAQLPLLTELCESDKIATPTNGIT
jgi:integrase